MNLDRPDIAYQVISGAPAGTCLFLAPLSVLKTLDDALTRFSGEAGARPAGKLGDIEFSREHLLFRVEPRISWVSEGIAAADPDFWNGKRP